MEQSAQGGMSAGGDPAPDRRAVWEARELARAAERARDAKSPADDHGKKGKGKGASTSTKKGKGGGGPKAAKGRQGAARRKRWWQRSRPTGLS